MLSKNLLTPFWESFAFAHLQWSYSLAPANLRYGEHWTNNLIDNWVDPMGDINGNPTNKECEMVEFKEDFKLYSGRKRRPIIDIMFSSTGSINSREPSSSDQLYNYYANPVTNWNANKRPCSGEWGKYLATWWKKIDFSEANLRLFLFDLPFD